MCSGGAGMERRVYRYECSGMEEAYVFDISSHGIVLFFFKQKTAYEIKECDWSSDVCSSDLLRGLF